MSDLVERHMSDLIARLRTRRAGRHGDVEVDCSKAADTIIALLEERERLREALEEIATAHLGDCPAAMEEVDHAHIHIINLRKIARAVVRDETRRDMSELTEWLRTVAADIQRSGQTIALSSTPFLDAADRIEALERELAEAKAAYKKLWAIDGIKMYVDEAHNTAIEKAAKWFANNANYNFTRDEAAAAIRALARKEPTT